ncbi:hypothetical protein NDA14_000148 [Ustilago hordei]|nr:hypothetical protein NDA14_000148 [Ustilago hordei]
MSQLSSISIGASINTAAAVSINPFTESQVPLAIIKNLAMHSANALSNPDDAFPSPVADDLAPSDAIDTSTDVTCAIYALLVINSTLPLPAACHGPGCSRSRRVTGSYGRSTGIEDLVESSREHGRSAVSMETMDSYGLTCKGGPSTATRRTKLKEQAQPRRGPSSRSMQMVTTQGLERQEPKELSLIKGEGAVLKESTPGHEEEEQC